MTGIPDTTSFAQRQPALTAGAITATATAIMAAFWAVVGDSGSLPWLTTTSQGLITAAIISIVALLAALWAQAKSTSSTVPTLVAGTSVHVTDTGGATLGHADVPTPAPAPTPAPDALADGQTD